MKAYLFILLLFVLLLFLSVPSAGGASPSSRTYPGPDIQVVYGPYVVNGLVLTSSPPPPIVP